MPTAETTQQLTWGQWYRNSKTGDVYRHIPFHKGQQAIWQSDARFLAYVVGKGGAKSSFGPIWLDREIRKNPKGQFIICAPTYKFLRQGILPQFLEHMRYNDLNGGPEAYKKGDGAYHLSTGGIVYIRSLDDPEHINAIHAHAIVADEVAKCPYATWNIIESRVALKQGRVLMTSTPYKRYRWLESEIIARYKANDPDYYVFSGASTINPAFNKNEFLRLKKSTPDHVFKRDYCGEFTQAEGTIFPGMLDCLCDVPTSGLPDGHMFGAIDWGYGKDPTAALVGILDRDDVLWLIYEYYEAGKDIEQVAIQLRRWHNALHRATGRSVSRWWSDHNPSNIQFLRRYRIPRGLNDGHDDVSPKLNIKRAVKGAGSIDAGIGLVNARIRTGRLKIIRSSVKALPAESDSYYYDVDEEGHGSGDPIGPDHCCDCLRYLCLGIFQRYKK